MCAVVIFVHSEIYGMQNAVPECWHSSPRIKSKSEKCMGMSKNRKIFIRKHVQEIQVGHLWGGFILGIQNHQSSFILRSCLLFFFPGKYREHTDTHTHNHRTSLREDFQKKKNQHKASFCQHLWYPVTSKSFWGPEVPNAAHCKWLHVGHNSRS